MRGFGVICLVLAACSYDYERLRLHDAGADVSGAGGLGGTVGAAGASGTGGTIAAGTAGAGGAPTGAAGTSGQAGRGGNGGFAGMGTSGRGGTGGIGGVAGAMAAAGTAGTMATAGTTGAAGHGGTAGSAGAGGAGVTGGAGGSSSTAGTGGTATTPLTVKLFGSTANAQWVYISLRIANDGTTVIPMSELTIRYWYTFDTAPVVAQADMCLYAFTPPAQCSNITRSWTAVSPARVDADFYYQVGFAAAAGNLNVGATAEFQLGFHKNDFSIYTQTNDYSFNGATAFTTTSKVTVYRQGVLVYGTEPSP